MYTWHTLHRVLCILYMTGFVYDVYCVLCMKSFPGVLQSFDAAELQECIRKLVEVDQDWVPRSDSASLYIRPTFLGTEVSDKNFTTIP